jgi:hypothetical protein
MQHRRRQERRLPPQHNHHHMACLYAVMGGGGVGEREGREIGEDDNTTRSKQEHRRAANQSRSTGIWPANIPSSPRSSAPLSPASCCDSVKADQVSQSTIRHAQRGRFSTSSKSYSSKSLHPSPSPRLTVRPLFLFLDLRGCSIGGGRSGGCRRSTITITWHACMLSWGGGA